jgi:hypothetical protein
MATKLNLSHARSTPTATSTAAQVDSGSTGHEDRDNNRGHITSPAEPEEGNRGLGLTAALGHIASAVGDLVVYKVVLGTGLANKSSSSRFIYIRCSCKSDTQAWQPEQ